MKTVMTLAIMASLLIGCAIDKATDYLVDRHFAQNNQQEKL